MSDVNSFEEITKENVEEIQQEAKRTFSLRGYLQGATQTKRSIMLFGNPDAISKREQIRQVRESLQALIEHETDFERKLEAQARFDATEEDYEEANKDLLESAIRLDLRALPNSVVELCTKKARRLGRAIQKKDPEDYSKEEVNDVVRLEFTILSLAKAIEKMTVADGAENTEITEQDIRDLHTYLPFPQWLRLSEMNDTLQLVDALATAATSEPGF